MKTNTQKTLFAAATVALGLLSGGAAQAFDLGPTWSYTMDSFADGTTGHTVGATSSYEIYGVALKSQNGIISVAFNANVGIGGHATSGVTGGSIGWGDLFFNFSGQSFQDASAAGKLYAVRFAGANDAGVSATGVYKDVTAKGVALDNHGHGSFGGYVNYVAGSTTYTGQAGSAGLGGLTVQEGQTYFGTKNGASNDSNIQNVINTGTKVGDITSLGANEIADLTAGFGQKGGIGSQTFGFSFAQSLLPAGKSVISVLLECINDSMALQANIPGQQPPAGGGGEQVPEPFTMAGFALAGLGMASKKMKQRRA